MATVETPAPAKHITIVARELDLPERQVAAASALLAEGATVPFVARYRKEATGNLDEVQLIAIRDRLAALAELAKRREAIRSSLQEHGVLTEGLSAALDAASSLARLEDIYLPYRPKRRTRAGAAREAGLEPLAQAILDGNEKHLEAVAEGYVNAEAGIDGPEAALHGARDIIAEWAAENPTVRDRLRRLFAQEGVVRSRVARGKSEEGSKYRDYFEWAEPARRAPSHRILAMMRGAKEGMLTLHLLPEEEPALGILWSAYGLPGSQHSRGGRTVERTAACREQLEAALTDSYHRLLAPSMETEALAALKKRADAEAITVFADNLRELLLAPPLGERRILALDPGLRTGCKLVCLDAQGGLLHTETIFPLPPVSRVEEARRRLDELCRRYRIEAIAVGNGTGGRETVAFLEASDLPGAPPIVSVNESGASVYSASAVAREEFADYDLTVRGAVSIGRRLLDPLAELVKIDPKSIGVGQYQHDVDQRALQGALDDTVSLCVNAVGVEVNTASKELLSRVSGVTERVARALVDYRREHGPLASRGELLKVPGMGAKGFEQAAGFLRIRGAENPLDSSAVHPESYPVVERMAKDLGCRLTELVADSALRRSIELERYVSDAVGLPTLRDILTELEKPGRDPRRAFEVFSFAAGVEKIEDLAPGMRLPGIVTNVTAFGAFVDVGVHQDGLVHVSKLADRYVRNPNEVVRVGQQVVVQVIEVDLPRRRISLSMREATSP